MRVREATEGDIMVLTTMSRDFVAEFGRDFSADNAAESLRGLISGENTTVLVCDGDFGVFGMAGVVLFPEMWNHSSLVAQELFWWIEPAYRKSGAGGELLLAIEEWSNYRGASRVIMAALDGVTDSAIGRSFERRGYRKLETNYVKEIG